MLGMDQKTTGEGRGGLLPEEDARVGLIGMITALLVHATIHDLRFLYRMARNMIR